MTTGRRSPTGGRRVTALVAAAVCCGLLIAGAVVGIPSSQNTKHRASATSSPAVGLAPETGSPTCSVTASTATGVDSSVRSAGAGTVVCLRAGSYAGLDLSGAHSSGVTVQPAPGQSVTVSQGLSDSHGQAVAVHVEPGTSHLSIHALHILGMVELDPGSSFIRIDHNDISGGRFGVLLSSEDCTAPNAPRWAGCTPEPKITNVMISGNRIHNIGGPNGDDALNVNNFANLRITRNELFGMLEGGNHTDCLQSTFGGSGLIFDHNYEHDNNCQGFFIKDGDVSDAIIYDNLFIRDQVEGRPEANIDIFNAYNLTIRKNTSWSGTADIIRDEAAARQPHATVNQNVFQTLANGCCNESAVFTLSEASNIFLHSPLAFHPSASDQLGAPKFMDPATGDYRLADNPHGIGIDWRPADQHYGP